jgi:PAS domain S-box-containing protein
MLLASILAERKQAKDQLAEKNAQLQITLQASNIGLWDWNLITNDVYFSPEWKKQIGYEIHEFPNRYEEWETRLHPEDRDRVLSELKDYIEKRRPDYSPEFRLCHKNGSYRWILVRSEILKNTDGIPFRMLGCHIDITERKQSENELLKAKKQTDSLNVELLNKHKELEEVLFASTHDLRTPLVNIQGYSKLMGDKLNSIHSIINKDDNLAEIKKKLAEPLNKDIPEMFSYIRASVSKMDAFLSGLLKISRLGRSKINQAPIDMNKLISQAAKQFEYKIQQNEITFKVLELPPCLGDAAQVDQVFSNLIDNALKYICPERNAKISISGKVEDKRAIYCVEDNGIGIPTSAQQKIFNIFHQAHKTSNGEGIGLAIVQKIALSHKGKVWVESEPDKGSKFYVSLPVKAEG